MCVVLFRALYLLCRGEKTCFLVTLEVVDVCTRQTKQMNWKNILRAKPLQRKIFLAYCNLTEILVSRCILRAFTTL